MDGETTILFEWLEPTRRYPRGVELFREKQMLTEVLYIASGTVKLACTNQEGHESILQVAFAGAWLGTASVIAAQPTSASAITCVNSHIQHIRADAFCQLLQSDRDLSVAIHKAQSLELCKQTDRIKQLSANSSRHRLRRVLREFISARKPGGPDGEIRVSLPIRHWELAQLIAITPEHLSRLLRELEDEGVIRRSKGWIIVRDLPGLCPDSTPEDAHRSPWRDAQHGAA